MKELSAQTLRLSAVAAALLLSSTLPVSHVAAAEEATVNCGGVTGCHGSSDCKTATNACKGQNTCMGQGFKVLTPAECKRLGGKVLDSK
ncbi:MAG TPA: hypothetical protein VLC91_16595 [Spongiibacteraceae bacterium]|nr:hypothetical protein [Spongiibacteraceae bacterium]